MSWTILLQPPPPPLPLLGTTGTEILQFGLLVAAGVWFLRRSGLDPRRFVATALATVSLFYLLCPEDSQLQRRAGWAVMNGMAMLQGGLMGFGGTEVQVDGVSLVGSVRFTYGLGCMGLSYLAMGVLCVLAYPMPWGRRAIGALVMAGSMIWLNVFRLIALYHLWELGEAELYHLFHRAGGGFFAAAAAAVFCGLLAARPRVATAPVPRPAPERAPELSGARA